MTQGSWESASTEVSAMAKKAKKPRGWVAFDRLARKLVKVPKEEAKPKKKRRRSK